MKRLILTVSLALAVAAPVSAETGDQPLHLVISHGMITVPVAKPVPATLRNAVEVVHSLYPRSSIALTGLDDVALSDLTLDWPTRTASPEPLINALGVACHYAFRVDGHYGPAVYFLSPARDLGPDHGVQVFNLKNYLEPGADQLRVQLRNGKAQLQVWAGRYADNHPKMQDLRGQIAETQALLDQVVGTADTAARKVKQLTDLIAETVEEVAPGSPAPKFYFHRELSLLVVVGDIQGVSAAQKVIAALQ